MESHRTLGHLAAIFCTRLFPGGMDCILSRLRLSSLHRRPTTVQSLTPDHELDIALLGHEHADCPILDSITIPRFITPGQWCLFKHHLGLQGSKGFPDQQVVLQSLLVRLLAAASYAHGSMPKSGCIGSPTCFSPLRAQISGAGCFSNLANNQLGISCHSS